MAKLLSAVHEIPKPTADIEDVQADGLVQANSENSLGVPDESALEVVVVLPDDPHG